MSTGFTIDDVRDTLTADVTRFLGRIEATAREILERKELSADAVPDVMPLFQTIGDHGHAIYGTSSLVSAESLSTSAHALEELALRGRDELALAASHLERARQIASALVTGAGEMLAMLSLELEHRRPEADKVASGWRQRAEEILEMLVSQVSAARAASDAVASLRALRPAPAVPGPALRRFDEAAWGFDEGWSDSHGISAVVDGLQQTGAAPPVAVSPDIAHAGPLTPPLPDSEGFSFASAVEASIDLETGAIDAELAATFHEEARETFAALAEQLAGFAANPSDPTQCRDLERSYHTLKGAAATVGLLVVSERAAELQARVEALFDAATVPGPELIAALIRDTEALRTVAGLGSSASVPAGAPAPLHGGDVRPAASDGGHAGHRKKPADAAGSSAVDDTRAVFLEEAGGLYRRATQLTARLAAVPGDRGTRDQLRQLLHRLKGSALVVADEVIAGEARSLHEALAAEPLAQEVLEEGMARLAGLLGIGRSTGSSEPRRVRHPVPIPDPELEPGFQQECAELLDGLDRAVLALESSERPREQVHGVLRAYHTLKGVVNAMGLSPTGEILHRIEDFLGGLESATILPPLRGVVSLLLDTHAEIRRHMRTALRGYVEIVPGRFEQRLRRITAGESRDLLSGPSREVRSGYRLGEGSEGSGASAGPDRKNLRISIDRLDALMNFAGELVISRSRLLSRIDTLRVVHSELGRSNKRLIDVVEKFRDDHEFSPVARRMRGVARTGEWAAFGELELDRYEDVNILARSLAESSTDMQELFGQFAGGLSALVDDSDALGSIVTGIQSEVTQARMVPLGTVFSRLQLPIRDAALRQEREVKVVTAGEDVHLDKTIVDALFQPMLHLVRNAASHGFETPARRAAAGKPAVGTLTLRGRQELGQIVVEVVDDGAGLDLERLHARGVAMGLISADLPIVDPRVADLVFASGLTTQPVAGAVSGRGVGGDVVRRTIERLGGSVRVETVVGQSTAFVITLPLTLAITRALLIRHAGQIYAVPLYFAERILDVREHQLVESAGARRIEIDGMFAPVRRLGELLGGAGGAPPDDAGPILIVRVGDQRLAVQVDGVVGQEEIVVKSMGSLLIGHPRFAGITIRGGGDIVLILDVPSLFGPATPVRAHVEVQRPRPRPMSPRGDAPSIVLAPPAMEAGVPLRVLFVDDSVSVRKVAERALRGLGVSVTLAVDGLDAIDRLHTEHFDVVFTDLEMPRMHGYELIRELRFLPAYCELPIIVVTSRSGKKHRDEAHALGASDYLTKPFSPQSLAAALVKFGGERARNLRSAAGDGVRGDAP